MSSVLVAGDWAQLESVIMAHFSGDAVLTDIILSGKSIHDVNAERLGISRGQAKTIQYLKQYDGGVTRAAKEMGKRLVRKFIKGEERWVAPPEVQQWFNDYDLLYEGISRFKKESAEYARVHGYVRTILGRRRYLPLIHSQDRAIRSKAARQSGNVIVQGSAADIAKLAMVKFQNRRENARILLQVHDEIVVSCPEKEAERIRTSLQECMEQCISLRLPLKAEVKIGKTWADCK